MTPEQQDIRARNRFFILSLLRLGGAAMVMTGLVITSGRYASLPPAAGYVILVVGFLGFALLPKLLARRWRTPPGS